MIVGLELLAGGAAAGLLGSLLGLGGGILIVPLLTFGLLGFALPIREAVGISLISVIVTSSASAGVYLERHVANLRLGMVLELFTASGALVGGLIAFLVPDRVLAGLFAVLAAYTAVSMARAGRAGPSVGDTPVVVDEATVDDVDGRGREEGERPSRSLIDSLSGPGYTVRSIPLGIAGASLAGIVSALLGVGGGHVKVPVMHLIMGVPLRVATATSNLMIGITAAASAIIYLLRGGIDVYVAGPTALGAFVGATVGSRTAQRVDVRILRILFVVVLAYTAIEMSRRALGG